MSLYSQTQACVLCNEVHELRIHGYVSRLVRSHRTWENEEILILVIICARAKAKGLQYTKRMLPPFVIPECNINLEQVMLMYQATAGGPIDYAAAAELLGTVCERTIARHHRMFDRFLKQTLVGLASSLTRRAAFVALPEAGEHQGAWSLFGLLKEAITQARLQRSGSATDPPPDSWYVHPVYVRNKWRNRCDWGQSPSNLAMNPGWFPDSS